jgi:predicted amidohydrolase
MDANLSVAKKLIRQAARRGARLIVTPEMTHLLEKDNQKLLLKACTEDEDPGLRAFRKLASDLHLSMVIGSLAIRVSAERCVNRSYLIGPDGGVYARYDKMHMFDVTPGDGQVYRESAAFMPGDQLVTHPVPETTGWTLGLSICYDLRFPEQYRMLTAKGANILTVPAAFTCVTGQAHWEVLNRARAIENGAYILAAAQGGQHADGRQTWGHSMIVDPWGKVLAEGDHKPGYILAELDSDFLQKCRERVPAWKS